MKCPSFGTLKDNILIIIITESSILPTVIHYIHFYFAPVPYLYRNKFVSAHTQYDIFIS